jgi:serine/threonine-protein kinase
MGRGDDVRTLQLGRYAVFDEIASGGMASVFIGRLAGPGGFSRTVAVKRLHPHLARDPHFAARFLEEARLAARVRHPNVVSIIDVVEHGSEVALIMDFVLGESLAVLLGDLCSRGHGVPAPIASGILVPVLQGLHSAHETRGDDGSLLGLIHRDVSPQNILVGADGVARVLDFGIAKAATLAEHQTQEGILKGKIGYLAPEQIRGQDVDRRVDVFAAGIVLWEMLTGSRLFKGSTPEDGMRKILEMEVVPPSRSAPLVPAALDVVTLQALAKEPDLRFSTAADMAFELERCSPPASSAQVGAWLESIASDRVGALRRRVSRAEASALGSGFESVSEPILLDRPTARTVTFSESCASTDPSQVVSEPTAPPSPEAVRQRKPLRTLLSLLLAVGGLGGVVTFLILRQGDPAIDKEQPAPLAVFSDSTGDHRAAHSAVSSSAGTVGVLDQVTALVSGPSARFTCALREDRSVWCWGDNQAGQIGDGSRAEALHAVKVAKLDPAVEVAAGNRHACAVLGDTQVACWGKDLFTRPTRVMGLGDVLHVRCGGRHACVSRNDGTLLCWGDNDRGQLGTSSLEAALTVAVDGLASAKQLSTGTDHTCAVVDADGSVWCWGDNTFGQLGQGKTDREPHPRPLRVPGLPPSVQVEAGDKTTFARTRDGHAYGWGFGIKRPVRLAVDRVVRIAAGGKQNCAIDADGAVWCWGFNDFGQLGGATAEDSAAPVRVASLSKVEDVAVGDVHVCVLLEGGEVACWGSNEQGQLGIGTKDRGRYPEPRRVLARGCP